MIVVLAAGLPIKQWAFTPPFGFEASLFEILLIVGGSIAVVLFGVWAYKRRKAHASKAQSHT
jgi:hypothetical protein